MAPRISLIVPYRGDDGERDRIWAWCRRWWVSILDQSWEVILTDSGDELFHRGKSLNQGVARSHGQILILADADTIVSDINNAIELAEAGRWSVAYADQQYYNLTKEFTQSLLLRTPGVPVPLEGDWDHRLTSWSGVIAMPRKAFEEVNGLDERCISWGYDDDIFKLSLDSLWGPCARANGHAVHLWHPRGLDFDNPYIGQNKALCDQYRVAAPYPDQVRSLVSSRG